MKTFEEVVNGLLNPEEFKKLALIGGHKKYHLEGNALIHTELVWNAACKMFGEDHFMTEVALLHDIGKIYTSVKHGDDDWEYPDHATCGGFRGILCKFIPETHPLFKAYQWLITNHIKPLFWQKTGIKTTAVPIGFEEHCTISNLAKLALCDLEGSVGITKDTELINYLTSKISYANRKPTA